MIDATEDDDDMTEAERREEDETMAFVGQMLRNGEWVRMGRECDSRAEAEGEVAHHLSVGTACDGRDDFGTLLPNNATRVVEIDARAR